MPLHGQCHLIAVCGGKGGIGKSVFAANFAQALMLEMRTQVLLIDLDAQSCGDQNVILGLRPNRTIGEAAAFSGQLSASTLNTLTAVHPSGLHFLGAVKSTAEDPEVNPEGLRKVLERLSAFFPFIVIDIGSQLSAPQLAVLEQASCAAVVTS
jgi:pilus assembly protein CpaF